MTGTGLLQRVVVALAHGFEMLRVQCCELRILTGIVVIHGRNHTVFQSTGNLGIMAILAMCGGTTCDSKDILDIRRTHY